MRYDGVLHSIRPKHVRPQVNKGQLIENLGLIIDAHHRYIQTSQEHEAKSMLYVHELMQCAVDVVQAETKARVKTANTSGVFSISCSPRTDHVA